MAWGRGGGDGRGGGAYSSWRRRCHPAPHSCLAPPPCTSTGAITQHRTPAWSPPMHKQHPSPVRAHRSSRLCHPVPWTSWPPCFSVTLPSGPLPSRPCSTHGCGSRARQQTCPCRAASCRCGRGGGGGQSCGEVMRGGAWGEGGQAVPGVGGEEVRRRGGAECDGEEGRQGRTGGAGCGMAGGAGCGMTGGAGCGMTGGAGCGMTGGTGCGMTGGAG